MTKVAYQGPADIRILTSDDVQQVGVEAGVFKKTEFYRDQPVELDDSVANALIENGDVFGKFAVYEEADAKSATDEAAEPAEPGEATSTGANTTSDGSPSGTPKSVRSSTGKA